MKSLGARMINTREAIDELRASKAKQA